MSCMAKRGNIYSLKVSLNRHSYIIKLGFLTLFLIISLISCKKDLSEDILVFAAASLSEPLLEIGKKYQKAQVNFDFAGSYTLSNKIRLGANPDLIIFAGMDPISDLIKQKYVKEDDVNVLLKNGLTIICSKKIKCPSKKEIFNSGFKISIADPDLAPLGKYSKQFIEKNKKWDSIKNQLIFNLDARATLVSVESGNVPIGIVYSSDALLSDLVEIIFHVESTSIVVEYPVAVIGEKAYYQKTINFFEYLTSDESSEVFSKFGFEFLE